MKLPIVVSMMQTSDMRPGLCGAKPKLPRGKTVKKPDKKGFCDIFTPLFVQVAPQGSGLHHFHCLGFERGVFNFKLSNGSFENLGIEDY